MFPFGEFMALQREEKGQHGKVVRSNRGQSRTDARLHRR